MDIALGISILTPILVRTMDAIQAGQDHVDVHCVMCNTTHAWGVQGSSGPDRHHRVGDFRDCPPGRSGLRPGRGAVPC